MCEIEIPNVEKGKTMKIEEFLLEWFGVEGRELGKPERFYTRDPQDLLMLIEHGKHHLHPVYMSVQPYSGPDQPCAIEKLYLDFDCKENLELAWREASTFAETLKKHYHVEPLVLFSGCKGFSVYAFMEKTVEIKDVPLLFAKDVYRELQSCLIKGLKLKTLDPQPLGDIKRLSRVPFSLHEKTSSLCVPVDHKKKPFIPESLDVYRTLDPKLLSPIVKKLKSRVQIPAIPARIKGIRPCIQAALNQPLEGKAGHLMRLAITREYLAAGCSIDEIVALYKNQQDYNPQKTRYYVEYAQKHPAKPFKCETIRKLGFCLSDCKGRCQNE